MKSILEQENPLLRQVAETVAAIEFQEIWLHELVKELFLTMEEKGAVGVAAPQIGVSKRVIVFGTDYTKSRKIEKPIPNTVLINPVFTILSDEIQIGYEGCLNFGDLRGEVPRAMVIEYSGFDLAGNYVTKQASDLEARIVQHEIDHLDGILFVDRVIDKESLTTAEELIKRLDNK